MKRRDFITLLGGLAASGARAAERVGVATGGLSTVIDTALARGKK